MIFSALLLGLSGAPHCIAMCGAASAGAMAGPGRSRFWLFHAGRLVGYSVAGAVAASSVGALASASQAVTVLRPLWTLLHVLALGLGLWLLWRGRQPEWLERLGRGAGADVVHKGQAGWRRIQGPARSAALGLGWVAWPCGLLQSALLVAALANGVVGGASTMAAFALASALGLAMGPALWVRLGRGGAAISASLGIRLAGLMLAGASTWALGHGVWMRVAAWCVS